MPYSERLRLESEPLPDVLLPELLPELEPPEEELPEPFDDPLVLSVVLPSFLEDEPDLLFEEDDLDPEALVVLLLSFLAEVDEEVDPDVEPEPPDPLVLLFELPPLLLLLLPAVLPDDDALGLLDELFDEFFASFEF